MEIKELYSPNKITTFTGKLINVMDLVLEDVYAEDIAMGLARECRFGNHTKKIWSVAEHSVWCMQRAEEFYPNDKSLQFAMLMHDAHEAYMGDWCTPMVDSIDNLHPGFKKVINSAKEKVQNVINSRFGIFARVFEDDRIRRVDKLALEWEWENKVLSWKGLPPIGDRAAADLWLHHFVLRCPVPHVIKP